MNYSLMLAILVLASGCTEEKFIDDNGREMRIVHGIEFNGIDRDQSGYPRLGFTLTNTTQNPLCVSIFTRSHQFGSFDFFLSDGTSYLDTASSYLWVPQINQPIKDDFEIHGSTLLISAGGKSEIYRILAPAVFISEAGVNMIEGTRFDGAFTGGLDLLAELNVVLYECNLGDQTQRDQADRFLFTSDKVGPFRVDIPFD